ncbi:unnamed protein product [Sphagnum jensenii]|uniref:HNH endonuclease n=1 Tax=Sphagnum jensenii TaxID=128206 RepID=A0ABP0V6Q3_9BRYO
MTTRHKLRLELQAAVDYVFANRRMSEEMLDPRKTNTLGQGYDILPGGLYDKANRSGDHSLLRHFNAAHNLFVEHVHLGWRKTNEEGRMTPEEATFFYVVALEDLIDRLQDPEDLLDQQELRRIWEL